jgi:7-cyano-7-deazaguanine synthase
MSKALVLFSGGQDSTTCLYWAKSNFEEVHAIGFEYGQRHRIELEQARKIAGLANVPLTIVDITGLLGNSALTDRELSVDAKHPRDPNLPATFVPGRNLFFLSISGSVAFNRGISDLVTGVCQTDYSGYPDCRREFIDHMERTLSAAMAPHQFRIHTPIMHIDKADTFKLAADLGVLDIILEQSHTDYHGDRSTRNPWGYGRLDNDASRLRAKGWEEFCRRYPHLVPDRQD